MLQNEKKDLDYWRRGSETLAIPTKAYIDGAYVDATNGNRFSTFNPANGREIAMISACDAVDVDLAVKVARRAFDEGSWSRCDPSERGRVLKRLAALILENSDELALLETTDMGKLVRDSSQLDIPGAAQVFRWFGEAVDKLIDEIIPTDDSRLAMITREPVGVVGAVVPWNFPLKMASWKCAPALAAGNSVILKPAEQSPLTALRLAKLATEAGIPDGVFNVLPGLGHEAGQAIGLHPDIDCVAFTGSTEVGKLFLAYSARSNMKRVWLECGGKSANIVFPSVKNIEEAAKAAAQGIFFNQGEVCSATSRLFVHSSIKQEFQSHLVDALSLYQPGDPLDPSSGMGALVNEEHTAKVLEYIDLGKKSATLLRGGSQIMIGSGGYFVEPTIFSDVRPDSQIAREEIFGPVLSVMNFDDEEDVIKLANASIFGLGASVWTSDLGQAHRTARRLQAGSVSVNMIDNVDVRTPFGGFKQSGNGRDLSLHAFDKYSEMKTTWISL